MEKIEIQKCETSFMTKKDFLEQKKKELFKVTPNIDEKLEQFQDNSILAIEFSISSPATVINIFDGSDVVKFMNDKFLREGISQKEVNDSFKVFESIEE